MYLSNESLMWCNETFSFNIVFLLQYKLWLSSPHEIHCDMHLCRLAKWWYIYRVSSLVVARCWLGQRYNGGTCKFRVHHFFFFFFLMITVTNILMQFLFQEPSFPDFDSAIKKAIKMLGGKVFPKLNWSSPKVKFGYISLYRLWKKIFWILFLLCFIFKVYYIMWI